MIKLTDKYSIRKIIPLEAYYIMKTKKNFMLLIKDNEILIEEEIDEWNRQHSLIDETKRIVYYYMEGYGYMIRIMDVDIPYYHLIIPYQAVKENDYNNFVKKIDEDLNSK